MRPMRTPAAGDRFGGLIERDDGLDFPFYDGNPVSFSGVRWLLLWLATVVAFLALDLWPFGRGPWSIMAAQLLFVAVPLVALAALIPQHWTALYHRVRLPDVGLMVVFWLLALAVQVSVGAALGAIDKRAVSDPAAAAAKGGDAIPAHFAGALPQLMGEELLTIIPFLALLWVGATKLGWSRRTAVIVALVISSLWFGAVHLPTYDWNLGQALLGIGLVRVVLTLAYVRTKNVWVCFGAHVLTDYAVFATQL